MRASAVVIGVCIVQFFTSAALGQNQAEALITAVVENALTVVNVDGDWGQLAVGNTYVISPAGFKNPPGPGEGTGIVVGPVGFEVGGNAGDNVVLTFDLPVSLVSDDQNGSIPVSNWSYGWNYDNDATASFNSSGPLTSTAIPLTIGGSGIAGVFLGATIVVPSTAFAGGYTAQVVGRATYTGN